MAGQLRVYDPGPKTEDLPLIHPPRLPATVPFAAFFLGRNVVSVLVEVYVAVVLPHVDLKLLRRPPPLPAVIRIAQTVITLG